MPSIFWLPQNLTADHGKPNNAWDENNVKNSNTKLISLKELLIRHNLQSSTIKESIELMVKELDLEWNRLGL